MAPRTDGAPDTWMLPGLGADGADPELADRMRLFGQFVGDWDIDWWWLEPDGSERRSEGRLHVRWILGGRAVQDIWSRIAGDPPEERPAGTTLRFPNPGTDTWTSVWIAPARGLLRRFVARQAGDEIVLETTKDDGHPEHWIFSEITPTAFRWHSEESWDHGTTWKLTEEMRIRRSAPSLRFTRPRWHRHPRSIEPPPSRPVGLLRDSP